MKFLGMGGFEFVIIIIVVLLIFGPKNLPKLGNALGKTVSNLRSGMNEGKKKKEEEKSDEEAPADDEDSAQTKPAEIEGEVETVEFAEEDAVEESAGAPADKPTADAEAVPEPAEPETGSAEPQTAGESRVSQAAAPKKVRRVVKKKVAMQAENTEQ